MICTAQRTTADPSLPFHFSGSLRMTRANLSSQPTGADLNPIRSSGPATFQRTLTHDAIRLRRGWDTRHMGRASSRHLNAISMVELSGAAPFASVGSNLGCTASRLCTLDPATFTSFR